MLVAVQTGASHEQAIACTAAATGRVRAVAGHAPSLDAKAGEIDLRLAGLRTLRRLGARLHEMNVPVAVARFQDARVMVAALRPRAYVPLTRRCPTLHADLERDAVDYYAAALGEAERVGPSPVAMAVATSAGTTEALRAVTSLTYAAAVHPESDAERAARARLRAPNDPHDPAGAPPVPTPPQEPILDRALASAWRRATYRTSVLLHDAPAIAAARGHLAVVRESPTAHLGDAAEHARPVIAFLGRAGAVQV